MRRVLKNIIRQNDVLKRPLIFYYTLQRRPWSVGYSCYKYSFIKNAIENNPNLFQSGNLPGGYGFRLDERVVEYPWFFSVLKDDKKKILDAGSSLNHPEILSLKALQGREVHMITLSPEDFKAREERFIYTCQDLRKLSYPDGFFDAVVSISTLEHIGMDNTLLYTSAMEKRENVPLAYLDAVKEMRRVLKESCSFYATVPFGKYKNYGWFQVFDDKMIRNLVDVFSPSSVSEVYFKYENDQWNFSNTEECRESDYFDIRQEKRYRLDYLASAGSVVCLEMVK